QFRLTHHAQCQSARSFINNMLYFARWLTCTCNLSLNENTHPLKYTKKYNKEYTGFNGDCDKEVYPMYNYLNWQEDFRSSVRGETMNSFSTTFHRAVYLSENRIEIYEEIGIDDKKDLKKQYDLLLENNNYQKFSVISKNLKEFERFAQLTQTIGDFTVLPNWMNTGRGCSKTIFDYWDLTLKSLYEFLFPLDAWETFVNKYYLHPFLDKNLKPMEFWDNHFTSCLWQNKSTHGCSAKAHSPANCLSYNKKPLRAT
ncbi:hypothetical protein ACFSR0_10965, partial [Enterococcus camelliae]